MNNKKVLLLAGALLYLFSAGISFFVFSKSSLGSISSAPPVEKNTNGQLAFDQTLPKTQACPLNGVKYSTQQEVWWQKHRPLGVMIENHEDARPQSGLSSADVIYEAVAEGGITRFLAVFYCQDAPFVGPVRSARTYFLDFISEYGDNPLYAHVGGANTPGRADALSQINDYGWGSYNDLNQFSIGFPTFWRDTARLTPERATEHTMYSSTTKLWDFAATNRKLTNKDKDGVSWDTNFKPYSFKDEVALADRGSVVSLHIEFWPGYKAYFVDWTYDKTTNLFKRNVGGVAHIDFNTKQQLAAKNIVVLFMQESHANDGYEDNAHLLYNDKGTGKAMVIMDGKQVKGTWQKSGRESRLQLLDSKGAPIVFDRGLTWFEIVPTDGVATVK